MKILTLILFTCSFAWAQNKDVKAIRSILADQQNAWNKGDLESFMQGYWKSDSLMFIGSSGIKYGWQNTLDGYKKGYPTPEAMGQLYFTIYKIEILASGIAYVTGRWLLKRKSDEPNGHFTLLWKKLKGKWVIVADHSS